MSLSQINEIRARSTALKEQLETMIDLVNDQIRDEARRAGNMGWVQHCAKEVENLQHDLDVLGEIEEHAADVLQNTLGVGPDRVTTSAAGLRLTTVEVTQGMLNQHLLTLTEARRRKIVKIGEQFTITLPDGTEFTTELCEPGNKLRERGHIRRFYEDQKIEDGDEVTMEEVSAGKWVLRRESEADRKSQLDELSRIADAYSAKEAPKGEKVP